ncbi:hypothetical protein [Variovorax paradoxus]|uniref:hypothetical protein n=1 Tax=Variovorax paradoxus TaxID=34073 RepID=UPI002785FD07|nr:hypothetical protein [Variovorax paradoxus]MDQ0590998.1 hypothetical protein [Variovorax paradoxus]
MDRRAELIDAIIVEIGRIFGENGFDGDASQYEWLLANYGITEEADVQWQHVCEYERAEIPEDDYEEAELEELYTWLEADSTVLAFLDHMLTQYRALSTVYPR